MPVRIKASWIWTACAILILLSLVLPRVDMSIQHESPRAQATFDPFDPAIIELEEHLTRGDLGDWEVAEARRQLPLLKARALARVGPMTPVEMKRTAEMLADYAPQIASQSEGSAQALRAHRDTLLASELPRLQPERITRALEATRQSFESAASTQEAALSNTSN
ncbi:hypothetical protein DL240_09805 [Lujinxingia litoralis]|uniref:Uncharacterized protein n=1 Tax=Lujinxingia litoralis TaxID=2211119 RepID=A0A328C6X8_9DELT|nr:hypothetical protein [Lujinxingia litoralis]RAL22140.1 hypothetical protein DL240_09805 [Lujinxingia litoralis]